MPNEPLVAIIAGLAALLVALTSLLASLLTSRQSVRSARVIEELKDLYQRQGLSQRFGDEELARTLGALGEAIQAIQRVKDEILLVLNAVELSLDSQTAVGRLTVAREALFECYERSMARLNSAEKETYHRAKNTALQVEVASRRMLTGSDVASILSEEDRLRLRDLHAQLTEAQELLRDNRSDRLAGRLGSV